MSLTMKTEAAMTVSACVRIAKNTPFTRLRNTRKPTTPATTAGRTMASTAVELSHQNGFQNQGTSQSASVSPTFPG